MREIKFRAFLKDENKMIYPNYSNGYYINYCEGEIDLFYGRDDFPIENTIIMQFTGLKDRNGVEIYEGDIVVGLIREVMGETFQIKGSIVYVESSAAFGILPLGVNGNKNSYPILAPDIEVIGNIYEHPHLLEGVK